LKATDIWHIATKWGTMVLKKKKWRFCAFLNKGSSKTPKKNYLKKVHVKSFSKRVEIFLAAPSLASFLIKKKAAAHLFSV
jgi:hypothetical protein